MLPGPHRGGEPVGDIWHRRQRAASPPSPPVPSPSSPDPARPSRWPPSLPARGKTCRGPV